MITVLFVCTSNFVRSPMAEACFRREAQKLGLTEKLATDSAGAYAGLTPRAPDRHAQAVCQRHGLDISAKRTREISRPDIAGASYIFTLDEDSFWHIRSIDPNYPQARIKLFLELSGQSGLREVPDPVLGQGTFEAAFDLIAETVPKIIAFIRQAEAF